MDRDTAGNALLLYCCSPHYDSGRVRELLAGRIAWGEVLHFVSRHRVAPLFYQRLRQAGAAKVPGEILAELQLRYLANAARNVMLARELLRLIDLFAARGIEVVPFKGPVLSAQLYSDLALRECTDIDILIRRRDSREITRALVSEGYRMEYPFTAAQQRFLVRLRGLYFKREYGDVTLDIQAGVSRGNFTSLFDMEDLRDRLSSVALEGKNVNAFGLDDTAILLCAHGGKHLWERLAWICDLAWLIGAHPLADWTAIASKARRLGVERMLLVGMSLTWRFFQVAPHALLQRACDDTAVASLVGRVSRHISGMEGSGSNSILWERTHDRFFYCAGTLLLPTRLDFTVFHLPRSLALFYYLLHLLRVVKKYAFAFFHSIFKLRGLRYRKIL